MEEKEAVRMRCCGFWVGGWVGGWETFFYLDKVGVVVGFLLPFLADAGLALVDHLSTHTLDVLLDDLGHGRQAGSRRARYTGEEAIHAGKVWVGGWVGRVFIQCAAGQS